MQRGAHPKRRYKRWSNEDLEYLQENWGTQSYKRMAVNLKRTINSIYEKANELGLQGATLSCDYYNARQIAKIFGIDPSVVYTTWKDNGLKIEKKSLTKQRKIWYVTYDDLMEFLKNNQNLWTTKKVKEFDLGIEPQWFKEKRRNDRIIPCRNECWTAEEDRQALNLYYMENLTYKAIGERLNRSWAGVANRIARLSQKKLRRVV